MHLPLVKLDTIKLENAEKDEDKNYLCISGHYQFVANISWNDGRAYVDNRRMRCIQYLDKGEVRLYGPIKESTEKYIVVDEHRIEQLSRAAVYNSDEEQYVVTLEEIADALNLETIEDDDRDICELRIWSE